MAPESPMARDSIDKSWTAFENCRSSIKWSSGHLLLVVAVLVVVSSGGRGLLSWLLLGLALVLWLGFFCKWLLENLKNFLVRDLLVGLQFGQIRGWWRCQLLEAIFGDCWKTSV